MDMHDWPYIKKSARRKKRLVKKDFDKQLIKLDRLRADLWDKQSKLPMVPLAQPYQKGWKRLFVLRDDIQQETVAEFYQNLLNKINTVRYHHDQSFKRRKKRRRNRYKYEESVQTLRTMEGYDWLRNTLKLTDAEKALFVPKEVWSYRFSRFIIRHEFSEPWRFVLVTQPRIIYEKKLHDQELEQEISEIGKYLDNPQNRYRLSKLRDETHRCRWDDLDPRYKNPLKKLPKYTPKEAYLDY